MKIYTKTGDKGLTGLIGGTRVPKNDARIEAYGTVDELNSFIGLLTTQISDKNTIAFLRKIQNTLFSMGAYLATDSSKTEYNQAAIIDAEKIAEMESKIDEIMNNLPKLTFFIIPGSCQSNATCHICRTIARRAERRILDISDKLKIDNQLLIYINRLSDYFFALSRKLTFETDVEEIYWKAHD